MKWSDNLFLFVRLTPTSDLHNFHVLGLSPFSLEHELRFLNNLRDSVIPINDP